MLVPWHLHIDVHRTDQFVQLLRDFVSLPPDGQIHSSGTNVDTCFTDMPHELVWAALRFARQCIARMGKFPAITAPRKGRFGSGNNSESTYGPHGSKMVLEIVHIEALITHELASGWLVQIRQESGAPKEWPANGKSLGGAH